MRGREDCGAAGASRLSSPRAPGALGAAQGAAQGAGQQQGGGGTQAQGGGAVALSPPASAASTSAPAPNSPVPPASAAARPRPNGTQLLPGHTGLRNIGNTCYINAVVQALSNMPCFRDLFLKLPHLCTLQPRRPPEPPTAAESAPVDTRE